MTHGTPKYITLCLLFLVLFTGSALAEIRPGSYTLSLMGGGYSFDNDQQLESSPYYALAVGHNIARSFSLELAGQQVPTSSKIINNDYNLWIGRLDLFYHLNPEDRAVFHLLAGGGIMAFEDVDGNTPGDTDGMVNYGLGVQIFLNRSTALRLDGRHILTFENSQTGGGIENFQYSAGLTFHMGGGPSAPRSVDSDRDGVIDSLDVCPGSPAGARVDSRGCTADSDGDGILDLDDQCPGTPAGVTVLRNGCPPDSDRDGVADHRDKCPDTPAGTSVDVAGCPMIAAVDSDSDGVNDEHDRCPGTPAGTQVDMHGCPIPIDSDRDGISDDGDVCPDTPAETKVDSSGCPLTDDTVQDALSLDIRFATGTSTVDAQSKQQLSKAAEFLKRYPESLVRIEGHTDSTGSESFNLRLSQQRAESVRSVLVKEFGVRPAQVVAKGYGESKPIAPNDTPEGRLTNRRVVISILR